MTYAMFRCCVTAKHLPEFDLSTDVLLSRQGVKTVEIFEFGCCGYPLKNVDIMASLASSARNLALAERAKKSILTSCACCYDTLLHSARLLKDDKLLAKINEILASEGLLYSGTAVVRHLLHVLKEDIGIDRIAHEVNVTHAFQNILIHYGCKLLRPSLSAEFGLSNSRSFLERVVAAAGATVVPWKLEKDCCGSSISTTDQALANSISQAKMVAANRALADGVVVTCPFCMLQLRKAISDEDGVGVLSVSQLVCLALGFDEGVSKEQLEAINTPSKSYQFVEA